MSIEVAGLTKFYGQQKALDAINFNIKKGEIVGFLGPNGAGKTTTMKILTGFMPPYSGQVKICNIDILKFPLEAQRKIGYLPEHNPLYRDMFVQEYLHFVSSVHKLSYAQSKIEEIIRETGLLDQAHKKINQLSKGYRQRVGLAQAMLHNPEVLILDEPTTGLDPNQILEIRSIIKKQSEEKTILLSTHIMQEVEALCDRVIIINKGRIIADGHTDELSKKLQSEEPIIVQFDKKLQPDRVVQASWVKEAHKLNPYRWKLYPGISQDIRPEVFDLAIANKCRILEMYKEKNSLEDVFRELTVI